MDNLLVLLILAGLVFSVLGRLTKAQKNRNYKKNPPSTDDLELGDKEVKRLIRDRRDTAAVRKYRKDHNTSLLEAKRRVDEMKKKK